MAQLDLLGDEALSTTLLGERTIGWGTLAQRPSTWHQEGFFLTTDTGVLYQNTGTEATPVWTVVLEGSNLGLIFALGE